MEPLITLEDQQRAVEIGKVFQWKSGIMIVDRCGALLVAVGLHMRRPGKYPRTAVACRAAELVIALLALMEVWNISKDFRAHMQQGLKNQEESAIKKLEIEKELEAQGHVPKIKPAPTPSN